MNQLERIATPEEIERQKSEDLKAAIRVSIPAIVTAVDLDRQVVSVRPAIMGKLRGYEGNVTETQYPILTEVPIAFPRAGGLCITYPVAVNDECLVVFADACIDFWWQSGGIQSPKDSRSHDLSDAIAIFGLTSQPRKLPNVSADAIEIRTDSRSDYISLTAGRLDIQINGETNVTANKSTVVCPDNTIQGPLTVTGLITGKGGLIVSGGNGASVTGTIHATGDISSGTVSLQNLTITARRRINKHEISKTRRKRRYDVRRRTR